MASIPGIPFKADVSVPDYASALNKGLNLFQNTMKSAYTPRNLENEAVKAEQLNQINAPYASGAQDVYNLDIGQKGAALKNLLMNMEQKKREYAQRENLNNFLFGGNINSLNNNMNRINPPGHMTSSGFEGSLSGIPAEDYYANTGQDRKAEQEAIDKIDRSLAKQAIPSKILEQNNSYIPPIPIQPELAQNIAQGLQNQNIPRSNVPGNIIAERFKYVYDNFPQYRKELASMGYKGEKEHTLTGPAREAESMRELRDKYGANSREVKDAEAIQRANIQRQEDLSTIRHRQMNGLKPGDTEIKEPNTGEVIGFRKQTTDKQKEQAKNTTLFNQLYPLVFNGASILSGPGATEKLYNAARSYKTNPASKKIIDDFLIAEKAATTTAVTEAARFGAGRTNQTFNRFVETLKSEDIPTKLKKWIKEFGIPYEANLKAGQRWQKELNKAEKLANKQIPATMDYYFDPDRQFAHEQEKVGLQAEESVNESNKNLEDLSDDELMRIAGYK